MHLTFQKDGEVGWDSGGRGWGQYQGLPGEEADSAGDRTRSDHGNWWSSQLWTKFWKTFTIIGVCQNHETKRKRTKRGLVWIVWSFSQNLVYSLQLYCMCTVTNNDCDADHGPGRELPCLRARGSAAPGPRAQGWDFPPKLQEVGQQWTGLNVSPGAALNNAWIWIMRFKDNHFNIFEWTLGTPVQSVSWLYNQSSVGIHHETYYYTPQASVKIILFQFGISHWPMIMLCKDIKIHNKQKFTQCYPFVVVHMFEEWLLG